MAWYKRQPGERVPIKEYLRATDAVSRPLAILLTIIVLFVCAALLFSLFIGGRWIYRAIFNDDAKKPVITQVEKSNGITEIGPSSTTSTSTIKVEPQTPPSPTPLATSTATISNQIPASQTGIPNTGPEPE